MNLTDFQRLNLLLVAEGLMSEEDEQLGDPGFAGVRQKRARRMIDTRAALLIGLDIARSLRGIRQALEQQLEQQ